MRFPESLSVPDFLGNYWQKRALNMPAALDPNYPSLSADELAWLATLPDVESRLVFTDRDKEKTTYRVEQGPFEESRLSSLPSRDWSLLVHDVEKHLPEFREYLDTVRFIPDWRVDDLMISVAAPGGSVGPHKDNYDVFLYQESGARKWRVADTEATQVDTESHELSLLKPFDGDQILTAVAGDVLYLPPGVPHWGVAETMCTTYSIGMRAPNMAELRAGCDRLIPDFEDHDLSSADSDTQRFYCDPDLGDDISAPGEISANTIARIRDQELLPAALTNNQVGMVLGSVVTDPKAWLAPDGMDETEARRFLDKLPDGQAIQVHGMARLAFMESGDSTFVFANGYELEVSSSQGDFFRDLCALRTITGDKLSRARSDPQIRTALEWLLTTGGLDAG